MHARSEDTYARTHTNRTSGCNFCHKTQNIICYAWNFNICMKVLCEKMSDGMQRSFHCWITKTMLTVDRVNFSLFLAFSFMCSFFLGSICLFYVCVRVWQKRSAKTILFCHFHILFIRYKRFPKPNAIEWESLYKCIKCVAVCVCVCWYLYMPTW